jgi:hypothetical protein
MQKKTAQAVAVKARFQKAFIKADVKLEGAVY